MNSLIRSGFVPAIAFAGLLGFGALGCGGDDDNPAGPGGGGGVGADVTITIVANAGANSYSPDPDTVTVGQTVSWKNNDTTTHTATADNATTFGTGAITPGATSTPIAMNTAGSFPYHCEIHPAMVATLVVVP
ncbi:MAG TPA: cupredoxin domain-containing protein [Candidatus Eisenbacteria bacterium]